jgi:hypothetical protein
LNNRPRPNTIRSKPPTSWNRVGIGDHDVGDRLDAEGGNRRQQAVGKDGADTSGKPAPEAARNRPLNDEDIHRPNGCRHQHADGNAGKHELDAGQHDMRAELQGAPIRSWRKKRRERHCA